MKPLRPNPITSEIDYSGPEQQFQRAMERYMHETGRKFPTWSEVLGVLTVRLGYSQAPAFKIKRA